MSRAAGLLLGLVADRVLGDPRRFHPVAGFGQVAARMEGRLYADSRAAGVAYTGLLVGGTVAAGYLIERVGRERPVVQALSTAVATWAVLGAQSLEREAVAMVGLLEDGDLPGARGRLGHLCARDARGLDTGELARATVESVAENTSDAAVGPLVWGGVFGVPGLVGYRAVNTLDAMVGYKSERYREFGWAAARLDDAVNLVPARVTAVLTALVCGRPTEAIRVWRRDAGKHPSPNAGPVEASFAGALGVQLGGANTYGAEVEDRGTLGDGPAPGVGDIGRTTRLARRVSWAAAGLAAMLAAASQVKSRGVRRWT